jgi:hypothetical protein
VTDIDDLGDRLEAAVKVLDEAQERLAEVLPAMHRAEHPRLNSYLGLAHRAGFTLDQLGQMVGLSRERIRQRIVAGDPSPTPQGPRFVIDEPTAAKLRALYAGADGRNPRKRDATRAYRAELARLHRCGATRGQLAGILGVTHAAVWQQLERTFIRS